MGWVVGALVYDLGLDADLMCDLEYVIYLTGFHAPDLKWGGVMRQPLTLSTGLVVNPRLFSSSCPLTGGHSPGFRICDLLFPQYQRSHTFS